MKKWVLGIIVVMLMSTLCTVLFMGYEKSRMYGGHTKLAKISLPNDTPSDYAITNVNVLSSSADFFLDNQTVLINNGIIISVGPPTELTANTQTIDGNNMFLVPGYTDSHVHLWESENDLLLYVANGVTQIREMNGSKTHLKWKKQVEAGRIGPDIFVVAPQLGTFGFFEGILVGWMQNKTVVRSESQINKDVQSFKNAGYDAIKASSFLDKGNYRNVSDATKDKSIALIGHIPMSVDLNTFLDSNQSEVAHVEELVKVLNREFGGYTSGNTDEFLKFVHNRSANVAERLKKNGKSVTSTLWVISSFSKQKSQLEDVLQNSELKYANPGITEGTVMTSRGMGWLGDVNIYRWPEGISEEKQNKSLSYWNTYAQAQRIMFRALLDKGVPIMAGTDANVPVTVPGFSLHDEMMALNEAGMSTSQILASVTNIPSRWMQANTGEISTGFKANLVLLRENPLQNIKATDAIEMVVINGRTLFRNDLDGILRAVQNANDNSRKIQIKH